ncbi:MAG: T9SS type A sorting domain-containing protein, partial [Bacteroidales bacterium]|nr:T9SS type A sorting domain-containing protein [Bacteroidales bacterium]
EEMFLEGSLSIFPNPCSGATHLRYSILDTRYSIFELYSISGVLLKTLNTGVQQSGEHELEFDVSDLPGGLYFIRMQSGDSYAISKLVVIH